MNTRRQETETTEPASAPAEPKKKSTTSDTHKAAYIVDKLSQIDTDEQEEIASFPASVRAKYERRRAKAREGVSAEVLKLVDKMRAP